MATKQALEIRQGETFQRIVRWEKPPFVYKLISAISQAAPAVVTAPLHGLVSGWRAAVVSSNGMEEINAAHAPPRDTEFRQATVIDVNNVELNDVNSADFSAYTGGGYLQYYTPEDLTGYTARMTIRDRIGGSVLLTLTSGAPDNRITISNVTKTITIIISAVDTAAYTATSAVYDLEMVSASGVVTTLMFGQITLKKEATT